MFEKAFALPHRAAGVFLILMFAPASARCADAADGPPAAGESPSGSAAAAGGDGGIGWRDVALFTGGAATAFLAHEAGHAASNLAFGNVPHLESVSFAGVVPFFAVAADISCANDLCFKRDGALFNGGRRALFFILMAGFDVQHITDELVLSLDPAVRLHHAPFRTGLLAFNTLTSVAYVVANLGGFEPMQGDVGSAVRDAQGPRALTAGLLVGIAAADLARWGWPEETWLAWVSRAAKVVFLGMPLAI